MPFWCGLFGVFETKSVSYWIEEVRFPILLVHVCGKITMGAARNWRKWFECAPILKSLSISLSLFEKFANSGDKNWFFVTTITWRWQVLPFGFYHTIAYNSMCVCGSTNHKHWSWKSFTSLSFATKIAQQKQSRRWIESPRALKHTHTYTFTHKHTRIERETNMYNMSAQTQIPMIVIAARRYWFSCMVSIHFATHTLTLCAIFFYYLLVLRTPVAIHYSSGGGMFEHRFDKVVL